MFNQLTGSCRINNYCKKVVFVSLEDLKIFENVILFLLYLTSIYVTIIII